MSDQIPYYVYKVTCIPTGQYYFGYRTRHVKHNRLPENDFWIKYYTSSKDIKDLIEVYGKHSFESQIIFKTNDLDKCYWYEQDRIKDHMWDILLLNKYYHDRELGHKQFRSQEATCRYCHIVIGSGNLNVHEITCDNNPNKIHRYRPRSPCTFCGVMRAPGILQRHELSCKQNPNKKIVRNSKAASSECQYCKRLFNNIGLTKHEKRCSQNLGAHNQWIKCNYCLSQIPKKSVSKHILICGAVVQKDNSVQRKLPCQYCNTLVGSCAISRHERACLSNPNQQIIAQNKVSCGYCNKLFGEYILSKHRKACSLNPNAEKFKSPTQSCTICSRSIAKQVLRKHEVACERKRFTCD